MADTKVARSEAAKSGRSTPASLARCTTASRTPPARPHSPATSTEPTGHDKLTAAWTEIASLAESLLNGESPIKLSNEQELVRFGDHDYWDY
jgi:hypothetical protein